MFRSDNDGDFVSKAFNQVSKDIDIKKQTFIPYKPQQNEVVERANRTIMKMARNMFHV